MVPRSQVIKVSIMVCICHTHAGEVKTSGSLQLTSQPSLMVSAVTGRPCSKEKHRWTTPEVILWPPHACTLSSFPFSWSSLLSLLPLPCLFFLPLLSLAYCSVFPLSFPFSFLMARIDLRSILLKNSNKNTVSLATLSMIQFIPELPRTCSSTL